jgi:acyl-CoA thioesterase
MTETNDGRSFLGLLPTDDPMRFALPVRHAITVGPPGGLFLFGGAGLAAGIAAAEAACGRPAAWAAAHYLSYARMGETLDLRVEESVRGNQLSQARVTGTADGREVLRVSLAMGRRDMAGEHQWTRAPDVPGPDACRDRPLWPNRDPDDLNSQVLYRVAHGRVGAERTVGGPSSDGRMVFWARPLDPTARIDALWAAIIADFVPSGLGHALGADAGGNSLDNTIRLFRVPETEWLLCEVQIHGVQAGIAHGRMNLFGVDGVLVATASQSMIVRRW